MISKESIGRLKEISKLEDVAGQLGIQNLKKKGKDITGICPFCASKKLTISPVKDIWKCFSCDKSGKGSISLIQDVKNYQYPEALKFLADCYNYTLEEEKPVKVKPVLEVKKIDSKLSKNRKLQTVPYRDQMLKASGLEDSDQKCLIRQDDATEKEIDRYQAGTINAQWQIVPGDDVVMHYVDLQRKLITYLPPKRQKSVPLIRIRWQNPSLHTDKQGTPMKYTSPYQSGCHLWIPNITQQKFEKKLQFDTLFIQEGEKKADKATKHGMISVGIMGIHNLAHSGQLPHEFELIIKTCGVKKVVFVCDSDCFDISNKVDKAVDLRPKTFLAAIRNFKEYFSAFNNIGIFLELFFAHVKPNEKSLKGMDDLLTDLPEGRKHEVAQDFQKVINTKDGQGNFINCFRIDGKNEFQLKEIFHLHDKNIFANYHFEKLKDLKVFIYGNLKFTLNEFRQMELAQPLTPEETYWLEETKQDKNGRDISTIKIHFGNLYRFLQNRHIGRYSLPNKDFTFVKIENKVISELELHEVKDFVNNFTEQIGKEEVLEKLYANSTRYLGPESLSNMKYINPKFHEAGKSYQFLYFRDKYWKITAEAISEFPLKELDAFVWDKKILDAEVKIIEDPLLKVNLITDDYIKHYDDPQLGSTLHQIKGCYDIEITDLGETCHFLKYLYNTSNIYHKRDQSKLTLPEMAEVFRHLLNKMTTIGYLLHSYRDSNVLKAVVAVDGKESEVGSSNGRTGKSLVGEALKKVVPVTYIPGKKKDMENDRFLWQDVDETTSVIFIDDVRVNFDFEFLFPLITGRMQIEGKYDKRLTLDNSPKVFLTTNHALSGSGDSHSDRQAFMVFSDYYGPHLRPIDDFGVLFFDEWEFDQWNMFYNLMATCLQLYFKFGIVPPPFENIQARKLRQDIGESFMDWADTYFSDPNNLNHEISRKEMTDHFYDVYPKQRMYCDSRLFKKKLKDYCRYKKLIFNPSKPGESAPHGGDDKRCGIEYFTVATVKHVVEKGLI
jgi:DNA primase